MASLPPISEALIQELDVAGPRYTSYPTVPEWSSDFGQVEAAQAFAEADKRDDPLGLYVHIPFCKERCRFCGCNVVVTRSTAAADRYLDYLERELDLILPALPQRRRVSQLHWGGGTPTFLEEAQIRRLYRILFDRFDLAPNAEVALEVDPVVTTRSQLQLLAELGFNRISMGVQDFDPDVQEGINRIQSIETTADTVAFARSCGFESVNFDLIYGLPRQTEVSFSETLRQVASIRPDRLAIYGFAFLPELRPHQKRLPVAEIPCGPQKHRLFRAAYETLIQEGYEAIGMDHFALPEDELVAAKKERRLGRNFQGYTVRAAPDTLAIGLTGISDIAGRLIQNVPQMKKYEAAIDAGNLPIARGLARNEDDRERGRIINELMCNFYVDLGPGGATKYEGELAKLAPLANMGLCEVKQDAIELTPLGGVFVRNVAMNFDAYLEKSSAQFSRAI